MKGEVIETEDRHSSCAEFGYEDLKSRRKRLIQESMDTPTFEHSRGSAFQDMQNMREELDYAFCSGVVGDFKRPKRGYSFGGSNTESKDSSSKPTLNESVPK